MSVKVMAAVWDREGLDSSERLVMLALADHADDEGRCYPSISRLCKRTSMSDRGVQKVISRLVEKGFVSIVQNGGRSGSNLYIVTATPEPRSPRTEFTPRTMFATPPNQVPKTPEPGSPKPSGTIIRTVIKEADASLEAREQSGAVMGKPPRSPPRRATSLPTDWAPSDRNISDAVVRNFTEEEIHEQAAAFRDYHLARGTAFKDWDAGWRTWLGNARRFAGRAKAPGPGAGSAHDGLFAGFQRAASRGRG